MISCSQDFLNALRNPIKQVFIKLEFYDSNMNYINEFTKNVTSDDIGSISVDSGRPVRRNFSFTLYSKNNEFNWSPDNLIWIDKRLKLYIGLKVRNGNIEYIPQGVFVITEPKDQHLPDGKKTTISGQDKAYLLTDRRGSFINQTTLAEGLNCATAIRTIASTVETQFNFDAVTETIPYQLTYEAGTSKWEAISEIAALAKCDIYYDVNGYLRLRKIDLNEFDTMPSTWTFTYGDPNEKFYAGNVRSLDDTICNRIVVLGGSSQTAEQRCELVVTESDPKWTGSPYTIQRIGEITYFHNNGNPDPFLGGDDPSPALWRAKYELMKRLSYTERLSVSMSPLYILDANDVISVEDPENSVEGKYLVNSFSLPINPQLMNCECLKYVKVIDDWDFM